jgi:hypothetical protein
MSPLRRWLWWTLGFVAFPLAGIAGGLVGPLDDLGAGLLGGALTGLVLGVGQSLAARGALSPLRWIPATVLGTAVGLAAGAALVGYRTSLGALALMGLVTGVVLGAAQAWALRSPLWAVAVAVLWPLGWTVTTLVGVDVEARYTLFGSTGAVVVSALSGLVLLRLTRSAVRPERASTPLRGPRH